MKFDLEYNRYIYILIQRTLKNKRLIAILLTILLLGLLMVPLDGTVDSTFMFFVGRFHPLLLHLPIGSLIILFIMEVINDLRPKLNLESACNLLLWFSVISIIPTVLLGVLLGSNGSYDDELLNTHKWLGWLTALVCVWMLVIRQKKSSSNKNFFARYYKLFLFVNVTLLSLAGHYGGHLTHGEDYLTKYMPLSLKSFLKIDPITAEYFAVNKAKDSSSEEALYYQNYVRPILQTHCFECHGEEKQKGEMRLDNLDWDICLLYTSDAADE